MELREKVVVITGGTKGLGMELAVTLAEKKAHVIVCARHEKGFENLSKEIIGIKADVTQESDLKNVIRIVVEKFGHVDLWINNAGIWSPKAPVENTDWDMAHTLMEVNLFGTVYGSRVALLQMKQQGFGVIMNIISTSALEGKALSSAYVASKYAASGFTKAMRKELEDTNIKVVSVYPGGMKSDFFGEDEPKNFEVYMEPLFVAQEIIKNLEEEIPLEELIIKRPSQVPSL